MSTSTLSSLKCIIADPDITGIGVRTAIYAQNLLSFAPAAFSLIDGQVSPTELDTLETQSTTILITAFAILVSTVIQVVHGEVTNYHVAIILNLSWMNNTNLVIYFLLYVCHRRGLVDDEDIAKDDKQPISVKETMAEAKAWWDSPRFSGVGNEIRRAGRNPVFWIGSIHLSLMAAIGVWLWLQPVAFGKSQFCSLSASLTVVGFKIGIKSTGLRIWSLLVYGLLLIPGFNLIAPAVLFYSPFYLFRYLPWKLTYWRDVAHASTGLGLLAVINIILLVDTESTLGRNQNLIDGGDAGWTFGQTLAILLLLVPLRDLLETMIERRPKKLGKALFDAAREGHTDVVKYTLSLGPTRAAKNSSLRAAFENGHSEAATALLRAGANAHVKDLLNGKQIHEAAEKKNLIMLKFLAAQGDDLDATRYCKTPLYDAAINGNVEVARCLLERGANPHHRDWQLCTPLHFAAKHMHKDVVQVLLEHNADANAPDFSEETPLHFAVVTKKVDIVEMLLKHKGDPNRRCSQPFCPSALDYALVGTDIGSVHNLDMLRTLIEYGANIHNPGQYSTQGSTIESYRSSRRCQQEVVDFLYEVTASIAQERKEGN